MAAPSTGPARLRRGVWVAVAGLVLITGAGTWWYMTQESTGSICTLGASIGSPVAADPPAAFAAWFEQSDWVAGGGDLGGIGPSAPDAATVPTAEDFERWEYAQWRWRYADGKWVQVDLAEGADGQWAVSGVNRCEEYHAS